MSSIYLKAIRTHTPLPPHTLSIQVRGVSKHLRENLRKCVNDVMLYYSHHYGSVYPVDVIEHSASWYLSPTYFKNPYDLVMIPVWRTGTQ